ncbi:hypothetical protein CEP52_010156 [Fusarium oligoseptatum]|uniref:Hard-surface induced protein 5 n=2 Tax=Fusarium solani species complex TaxID=232080 RepID=A0A428T9L9_9HYPO|nr:hypothetical protein CEP51_005965 [Fusarium floridanum]RSL98719.1 hypothetical protein CEP52_010156 [Fusarium oligoseptatum]
MPLTLTVKHRRWLCVAFSFCLIFFLIAAYRKQELKAKARVSRYPSPFYKPNHHDQILKTKPDNATFEAIARKHGTNKVTSHSYQFMYEKYLGPLQGRSVKFLEIGLGCNMDYGPGASYNTWLEFLPGVDLYFIENDRICAETFKAKNSNARIAIGDQASVHFLNQFANESTKDGLFDIIVDDGGHGMVEQITSLEELWKIVNPGGLYVIEDLQTSYREHWGGDSSGRDTRKHTTMKYVYGLLDDMMAGWAKHSISRSLESVDCMAEICVLRKAV